MARLTGSPSGIGDIIEDECRIEQRQFEEFTDQVVVRYQETNNMVLRSLMAGFISVALVLVQRGGGTSRAIGHDSGHDWHAALVNAERSMPRG